MLGEKLVIFQIFHFMSSALFPQPFPYLPKVEVGFWKLVE